MNPAEMEQEIQRLNEIISRYASFFIVFDLFVFLLSAALVFLAARYLKSRRSLLKTDKYLASEIKGQEARLTRIALELHDTVAQDLRYALVLLNKKNHKEELSRIIEKSLFQVRSLSENISFPNISKNDLCANLLFLCENFNKRTKVKIRFVKEKDVSTAFLTEDDNFHLYRIVQESLLNVVKHADATEATVLVRNASKNERSGVYIFVTDDGKGFDTEKNPSQDRLGLFGIKKRAEIIGATVHIVSAKNEGTQVSVLKLK